MRDTEGIELHITRADFWADNEQSEISMTEWFAYVESDPQLRPRPENGPCFVERIGPSTYNEPWLHWSSDNASTKWLDTALFVKMFRIAAALDAKIQEGNCEGYTSEGDWTFDPTEYKR